MIQPMTFCNSIIFSIFNQRCTTYPYLTTKELKNEKDFYDFRLDIESSLFVQNKKMVLSLGYLIDDTNNLMWLSWNGRNL